MSRDESTSLHANESLGVLRHVDDICTRFERTLGHSDAPSIEELLASADPGLRERLLRELLALEMDYRSQTGESLTLEYYRERFPHDGPLVKYLYYEHFVPAHIAEYSIQRLLGRGGFGVVFQGWDTRLMRSVALKVFRRDPLKPRSRRGGLLSEARSAAQLRHAGVVTVYAIQSDADGDEFLVLEYVDGQSLEEYLRSEQISPRDAARVMLEVVQALQHAHQQGLIHRDLKPANILLDRELRPRVTDFGLAVSFAALPHTQELAGTLAYMAPEQAAGETHRLDARTDLWAVGVILYRILAGALPFSGRTSQELLSAICHSEAAPVRDITPQVPPELARIVQQCMAKRISERYASAANLADDLAAFLSGRNEPDSTQADADDSLARVVPKGLRCFDGNDRDFFLDLVPGPRDRYGTPSAVLFWQRHLQEVDAHETFRVGLLYGPSGCGKSSLIRAGILPRLPRTVKAIVVEGARDETELVLIRELRRRFPEMAADLALPEMLHELREGPWLAEGEKLVLIFDQFEQWLHGWRRDGVTQLIEMLRQCDGARVQSLILVRDDFWMPATRFFQELDVPLVEGFNTCAVDLFDRGHAIKVLAAFGVAYARLDAKSWQQPGLQRRFLERAVDELTEDGWIVPVRLCIFAEMIKSKPWSPATLQNVGGALGLGATFLEEAFDGRSAPPMYRLHQKPARQVLERLLPPPGNDIRGHLVAESELQVVSGYEGRPEEFAALLRCLDQELRLITPSDAEPIIVPADKTAAHDDTSPRVYQLTHDFLVTAIRGWLHHMRRRTLRGRAELRLADYADAYSARHETRQLPSWSEWLSMLILTRSRRWRDAERTMMHHATRHHALRIALVTVAALLTGLFVYDRIESVQADGLLQALVTSDSRDVPHAAAQLTEHRRWTKPRLVARLESHPNDPGQRLRLQLGLLAVGESNTDELLERLLDADPPMAVAIADLLLRYHQLPQAEAQLWSVAKDDRQSSARRLHAIAALARFDPTERTDQWQAIADSAESLLLRDVAENPGHFNTWVDALMPVCAWLTGPLRRTFGDAANREADRLLAANILAQYVADDTPELVELALQSTPKQFDIFARIIERHADISQPLLIHEAQAAIPTDTSEVDKDRLARRQANAILLLRDLGQDQLLWPSLRHSPDPRIRSFLIDYLRQFLAVPDQFVQRLAQEDDPGIRQSIILVLGSAPSVVPGTEQRAGLVESLLHIYRDDVDSGVHSAAEWSLRRLGGETQLNQAITDLSAAGMREGFRWYVTKNRVTMIIFERPGLVRLGSPDSEPERDGSDESAWTCDMDWSFAISATEITQAQFIEICPGYKERFNQFAPDPASPANAILWLNAVEFCRLLSEHEGIPHDAMAIPAVEELKKTPYPDFRLRPGYRLPIEAEWEIACRAGTVTPRFYGYDSNLLSEYSCYISDSNGQAWPVAFGLPNGAGLFDVLGNVSEWCYDSFVTHPERLPTSAGYAPLSRYALRGNDFGSKSRMLRSANRRPALSGDLQYSIGFRIAHTILLKSMNE